LRGEKIDIVTWDSDPAKFICNALAPAEIVRVIVDETNHSMEVVVPDDQLSLAIGKKGQNVRLASRITGWRLDAVSESVYNQDLKDGYESLLDLKGVGNKWASGLYEAGFRSAKDVAEATVGDLVTVEGMSEKRATKLIEDAIEHINRKKVVVDEPEELETEEPSGRDDDKTVNDEVSKKDA
jgi:N utilization substance protein A